MNYSKITAFTVSIVACSIRNKNNLDKTQKDQANLTEITDYGDGCPVATLQMDTEDHGIVLKYGGASDQCDILGARDVWIFEDKGRYYVHNEGAGPLGWLSSLVISKDLIHWKKKGPMLDLGETVEDESKSVAYGVTCLDDNQWHMFYLGTRNITDVPNLTPSLPYPTMKAKKESLSGPWVKQKDVIPFRIKPGTYYSMTASPGQVIKQGDEYLKFVSSTTQKEGNPLIQRTLALPEPEISTALGSLIQIPYCPLKNKLKILRSTTNRSLRLGFYLRIILVLQIKRNLRMPPGVTGVKISISRMLKTKRLISMVKTVFGRTSVLDCLRLLMLSFVWHSSMMLREVAAPAT